MNKKADSATALPIKKPLRVQPLAVASGKCDARTGAQSLGFVDRWVDEKDGAAFLGVSTPYLQKKRVDGTGPKYAKLHSGRTGAVRYLLSDLHLWMQSKCRANTSEVDIA